MKSTIKEREIKMEKAVREIVKNPEIVKELGLIPSNLIENITDWYCFLPKEIQKEAEASKNKMSFLRNLRKIVKKAVTERINEKRMPIVTLVKYSYIFSSAEIKNLSKTNRKQENVIKLEIISEILKILDGAEKIEDEDEKVAKATREIFKCIS